jgi:hypothetical protein
MRFLVLVLVVAMMAPMLSSVRAQDSEDRLPASQIILSTIRAFIVICDTDDAPNGDPAGIPKYDTCQAMGTGSGTIIKQDGTILTNAHVAINPETGEPNWLLIGITTDARELPSAAFFARAAIWDNNIDLAIVKPMYTVDGREIGEGDVSLPPLPMAKNDKSVELEQSIRMIGYPGVGGSTITIDPAVVSGFGFDDRVPELAGSAWIKTSQSGGAGISGGTAVNDDGLLIGVPSAGGLAEIRCYDANGDGQNDPASECASTAGETGMSRPIPEAYNLLLEKAGGGDQPTDEGVTIMGRIISADTGDPIDGAAIIVYKPGVKVAEAVKRADENDVYTYAYADGRGNFILPQTVERGQGYGVVLFATGYQAVGRDNYVLASDDDPGTKDLGTFKLAESN